MIISFIFRFYGQRNNQNQICKSPFTKKQIKNNFFYIIPLISKLHLRPAHRFAPFIHKKKSAFIKYKNLPMEQRDNKGKRASRRESNVKKIEEEAVVLKLIDDLKKRGSLPKD